MLDITTIINFSLKEAIVNEDKIIQINKEKRVIHVIGRNNGHIKVPMISIGKCESNNRSRDSVNEINDSKVESNRSGSSRNAGHSENGEKNLNGFIKYLPISTSSRNSSRDLPYQSK